MPTGREPSTPPDRKVTEQYGERANRTSGPGSPRRLPDGQATRPLPPTLVKEPGLGDMPSSLKAAIAAGQQSTSEREVAPSAHNDGSTAASADQRPAPTGDIGQAGLASGTDPQASVVEALRFANVDKEDTKDVPEPRVNGQDLSRSSMRLSPLPSPDEVVPIDRGVVIRGEEGHLLPDIPLVIRPGTLSDDAERVLPVEEVVVKRIGDGGSLPADVQLFADSAKAREDVGGREVPLVLGDPPGKRVQDSKRVVAGDQGVDEGSPVAGTNASGTEEVAGTDNGGRQVDQGGMDARNVPAARDDGEAVSAEPGAVGSIRGEEHVYDDVSENTVTELPRTFAKATSFRVPHDGHQPVIEPLERVDVTREFGSFVKGKMKDKEWLWLKVPLDEHESVEILIEDHPKSGVLSDSKRITVTQKVDGKKRESFLYKMAEDGTVIRHDFGDLQERDEIAVAFGDDDFHVEGMSQAEQIEYAIASMHATENAEENDGAEASLGTNNYPIGLVELAGVRKLVNRAQYDSEVAASGQHQGPGDEAHQGTSTHEDRGGSPAYPDSKGGNDNGDGHNDGSETLQGEPEEEPPSRTVQLSELKTAAVARDVDRGISVIVTRHHVPYALIVPYKESATSPQMTVHSAAELNRDSATVLNEVRTTGNPTIITTRNLPKFRIEVISEEEAREQEFPEVSVMRLREHSGEILRNIEETGTPVAITYRKKPALKIVRIDGEATDYGIKKMSDLRSHTGEIINDVHATKRRVLITSHNNPKLWVVPVEGSEGLSEYRMRWFIQHTASVVDGVIRTGTPALIKRRGVPAVLIVPVEEGEIPPEDAIHQMRKLNQITAPLVNLVVSTGEPVYITRHRKVKVKLLPVRDTVGPDGTAGGNEGGAPGNPPYESLPGNPSAAGRGRDSGGEARGEIFDQTVQGVVDGEPPMSEGEAGGEYDPRRFFAIITNPAALREVMPDVILDIADIANSPAADTLPVQMRDVVERLMDKSQGIMREIISQQFAGRHGLNPGRVIYGAEISLLNDYIATGEIAREDAFEATRSIILYAMMPYLTHPSKDPELEDTNSQLNRVPFQLALNIFPDLTDEEAGRLFENKTAAEVRRLAQEGEVVEGQRRKRSAIDISVAVEKQLDERAIALEFEAFALGKYQDGKNLGYMTQQTIDVENATAASMAIAHKLTKISRADLLNRAIIIHCITEAIFAEEAGHTMLIQDVTDGALYRMSDTLLEDSESQIAGDIRAYRKSLIFQTEEVAEKVREGEFDRDGYPARLSLRLGFQAAAALELLSRNGLSDEDNANNAILSYTPLLALTTRRHRVVLQDGILKHYMISKWYDL